MENTKNSTDVVEQSEVGVLTKPEGDCGNLLYGSGINIDPGCKLIIIKINIRSLDQIGTIPVFMK